MAGNHRAQKGESLAIHVQGGVYGVNADDGGRDGEIELNERFGMDVCHDCETVC